MDTPAALQSLAALAHPLRLQAFRALVVAGPEGLAQKALAEALEVGPTKLAFHLKELLSAGLVTREQVRQFVLYRAAFDRMDGLLAYLTENCCAGAACAVAAPAAACGC
jgi:ArsR family transcriptional regulator